MSPLELLLFGAACYLFGLVSGAWLRQGELLALRWEDVDLKAGRLSVRHTLANVDGSLTLLEPKTDRSRRLVVLPEAVRVALRAHRTRQKLDRLVAGSRWSDSGHVFATMLGRPHHAATISRAFEQALARAELPHTRFHDLRHSAATFLLVPGLRPRGRQEPPGAQHHRADLEHLRPRPRAAPAGDGAGDGRGAGRVRACSVTDATPRPRLERPPDLMRPVGWGRARSPRRRRRFP